MNADSNARERIQRLLMATRRISQAGSLVRRELSARLARTSGLSSAGIDWAFEHCLELTPSEAELTALAGSVTSTERAHVILPANVFVAAHRAIAIALAAAPRVRVKPSRREPAFVEALAAEAPDLFECVEELEVERGDHVWAYGSDVTLEALRRQLPPGAVLHAHGTGFGVVLVDLATPASALGLAEVARAIADDTLAFDQRGCASPRLVLACGGAERATAFASVLAAELALAEVRVPRGTLDEAERADVAWYLACAACFGPVFDAGQGSVSVRGPSADGPALVDVPPVGRHLAIVALEHFAPALRALAPWLTCVGCASPSLAAQARQLLPLARVVPLGKMQTPAFDGPVDQRPDGAGEIIV